MGVVSASVCWIPGVFECSCFWSVLMFKNDHHMSTALVVKMKWDWLARKITIGHTLVFKYLLICTPALGLLIIYTLEVRRGATNQGGGVKSKHNFRKKLPRDTWWVVIYWGLDKSTKSFFTNFGSFIFNILADSILMVWKISQLLWLNVCSSTRHDKLSIDQKIDWSQK